MSRFHKNIDAMDVDDVKWPFAFPSKAYFCVPHRRRILCHQSNKLWYTLPEYVPLSRIQLLFQRRHFKFDTFRMKEKNYPSHFTFSFVSYFFWLLLSFVSGFSLFSTLNWWTETFFYRFKFFFPVRRYCDCIFRVVHLLMTSLIVFQCFINYFIQKNLTSQSEFSFFFSLFCFH